MGGWRNTGGAPDDAPDPGGHARSRATSCCFVQVRSSRTRTCNLTHCLMVRVRPRIFAPVRYPQSECGCPLLGGGGHPLDFAATFDSSRIDMERLRSIPLIFLLTPGCLDEAPSDGSSETSVTEASESPEKGDASGGAHVDPNQQIAVPVEPSQQKPSEDEYVHPLRNLEFVNGKAPFVEIIDAPGGERYAIVDETIAVDNTPSEHFSGIRAYPMAAISAEPSQTTPPISAADKIGGRARGLADEAVREGEPQRKIALHVRLTRPSPRVLTFDLETDIAFGKIQTDGDYQTRRGIRIKERALQIAAAQAPVLVAVKFLGGEVQYRCEHLACLEIALPAASLSLLAQHPQVVRLDAVGSVFPEGPVTADKIEIGHQLELHIQSNPDLTPVPYDGGFFSSSLADNLRFAVFETAYDVAHPAFRDGAGPTTRIAALRNCKQTNNVWSCPTVASVCNPNFCDNHSTGVAGIIFGDLFDDQISNQSLNNKRRWSGIAREARGYLYATGGNPSSASFTAAADDLVANQPSQPRAIAMNLSSGLGQGEGAITDLDKDMDPNYPDGWDHCNGIDAVSQNVNDLFEAGTLLVKSAGNLGGQNLAQCTVTIPGSAITAFTVGGHAGFTLDSSVNPVRNAILAGTPSEPVKNSARGGSQNPNDFERGRGRTIIDLTAYRYRTEMADGSSPGTFFGFNDLGTSFSAPVITATAVAIVDHFKRTISNNIDDPGILFATLLLMGDRAVDGGGKSLSTHDRGYGAGRLKVRRLDDVGLDRPWGHLFTSFCIGRTQVVSIPINNNQPLPAGVDIFKAVLWWYDRRHEHPALLDIANLDLQLVELNPDLSEKPVPLRESKSVSDNKERVFFASGLAGRRVRLKVSAVGGIDDSFSYDCPVNPGLLRARVAVLWEDSARDNDLEGPFWFQDLNQQNQPWLGVEPEDLP